MVKKTNKNGLERKLKQYIETITKAVNVDQIILFGSYAKGTAHKYSDIDLAVVSSDLDPNVSRFRNIRYVKEKTKLLEPGLQLFAYPTEIFFNEENTVHESFIREIKKTGKVIYKNGKRGNK